MKVKLLQHESRPETELAFKFRRPNGNENVYVPKSVISHISREAPDSSGWRIVYVEVKDWFAEKEDL
jgi:hypothetical protein